MNTTRLATIGAVLLFGLAVTGLQNSAEAGNIYIGGGYGGGYGGYSQSVYSGGYGLSNGYGYNSVRSYNVQSYGGPVWHDTTHYDYHPTTVYRHGNHFHVQPGHYDLHRSGHWHR